MELSFGFEHHVDSFIVIINELAVMFMLPIDSFFIVSDSHACQRCRVTLPARVWSVCFSLTNPFPRCDQSCFVYHAFINASSPCCRPTNVVALFNELQIKVDFSLLLHPDSTLRQCWVSNFLTLLLK